MNLGAKWLSEKKINFTPCVRKKVGGFEQREPTRALLVAWTDNERQIPAKPLPDSSQIFPRTAKLASCSAEDEGLLAS